MKFQYISEIIPLLEVFVQKYGGEVIPCKDEEIGKLESMLPNSCHFPAAFKEFLLYGGKKLGKLFDGEHSPSYYYSLGRAENSRAIVASKIGCSSAKTAELPEDIFVVSSHISSYVAYFKLTEGENPPIYSWSDEEELEIEAIRKEHNTFTDFIKNEIRIRHLESIYYQTKEKLETGKPPRGQQFWVTLPEEETGGINKKDLARYFGVNPLWRLEEIAEKLNIAPVQYLKELSGWKARQVGDEIRFFPPSYKSPEEKALEQQNQLESKKQELAKVEKIIANRQNRIKNLSGGKLTGGRSINFNNSSALRIKELELDLRKQKGNKRKLEKEIRSLEEDSK